MPLIPQRSVWDWAQKLVGDHHEPFLLVLQEILVAVERRELHAATTEDPAGVVWRTLLPSMIFAAHVDRAIPPEPCVDGDILTLTHRIMVRESDIEQWLRIRNAPGYSMMQPAVNEHGGFADGSIEESKQRAFLQWTENEKQQHASYPPMQPGKHGRLDVRTWARQNDVSRKSAEAWAKAAGLPRRGRPPRRRDN